MTTRRKSIVIAILCIALMIAMAAPALARYQYITTADVTISAGNKSVSFVASALKTPAATSVKVVAVLERQNGSGGWDYFDSWTHETTGSTAIVAKTVTVPSGTYRVVNNYSATGPNGTEYGSLPSPATRVS